MISDGLIAYYRIREEFVKEGCSAYEATLLAYYSVIYSLKKELINYGLRDKIGNKE